MIPTVTNNHLNNSSITSQNCRRHKDPSWLWIVASIGSVSLHLLLFLLMRSSDDFKPWFPQSNQSSIPIDFIEISSEPKSTNKPQSKIPKVQQQSSSSPLQKSAPTTSKNDNGEIISGFNSPPQNKTQKPESQKPEVQKPEVQKPEVQKPESQKPESQKPEVQKPEVQKPESQKPESQKPESQKPESQKPESQKPPVRQQSYPTIPTPEPTVIPESELPWNRRQEIKLGKGTLLPQDIPTDSPTPTPETSTNPNPEPSINPTPEPSINPNPEPSSTANGEGAIATVSPIIREEVSELIKQKQLIADALPDILAEYKGSKEKELEPTLLPNEEGLKPANILASLIIDKNGQFQQAKIITIEPATLRSEISSYEQALNQIFQQENFIAAYNQDGSKPDLSNLYIRLKIAPINSQ